jgi:hypothetical protein
VALRAQLIDDDAIEKRGIDGLAKASIHWLIRTEDFVGGRYDDDRHRVPTFTERDTQRKS